MKARIDNYINEYSALVAEVVGSGQTNWDDFATILSEKHGWTSEGANSLSLLVQDYGSFMLSHALALSILLQQEDGRLGF